MGESLGSAEVHDLVVYRVAVCGEQDADQGVDDLADEAICRGVGDLGRILAVLLVYLTVWGVSAGGAWAAGDELAFFGCVLQKQAQEPDDTVGFLHALLHVQHSQQTTRDLVVEVLLVEFLLLRGLLLFALGLLEAAALLDLPEQGLQLPLGGGSALGIAEDVGDIGAQGNVGPLVGHLDVGHGWARPAGRLACGCRCGGGGRAGRARRARRRPAGHGESVWGVGACLHMRVQRCIPE